MTYKRMLALALATKQVELLPASNRISVLQDYIADDLMKTKTLQDLERDIEENFRIEIDMNLGIGYKPSKHKTKFISWLRDNFV